MNPLRANPEHKLHLLGEGPGLLEQKVRVPFCRVMAERRRHACFKFQPVLYRRNFNRDGGAEAPSAVREIPARNSSKLDACGGLLIARLREGVSGAQKTYAQHGFCRV